VLAAAAVAAAWYSWLLLARDDGLATFGYDQAFFQQLVWNLDHGHWFSSSFSAGSFLGLHFEPLLVLPAIAELAWPDPRLLSLLAALSIAALAPAAYLFLSAQLGKPVLAAALAAPLPFWPALQEAARSGFHPEFMGLVLALLAGWAAMTRRPVICCLLAAMALTAKEDQAWNVLVVGLAVAASPGLRRLGLGLAGAAVAYGVVVVGLVMPWLRAGHAVDTASYYGWLATATAGTVAHALTLPAGWLAFLVILVCAAGLPLLRPAWLSLALPPLVADLLSAHDPQALLHLQYAVPLVLPVLVAAAMGAAAAARLRPAAVLAVPAALAALTLGSLPPAVAANRAPFGHPPALDRLQACTRHVPAAAPIAADDNLLAPLASRPSVRELTGARAIDYLVIDRHASLPGYVLTADRLRVVAAGGRPALCDDGRFVLFGPGAQT
jgi:uncharacterized membrane protein